MNEQPVIIRPATPADLPGLVQLEQACFAVPWHEESLRHDLEANPAARMFVAVLPDGTLAGYGAFWVVIDEGQINNIAVLPSFRRLGLGRLLLERLVFQAMSEHLQLLTLEVRAGNSAARALYQACGFEAVGRRRGYYADNGEDAIIMLKKIGQ